LLSENSKLDRARYHVSSFIWYSGKVINMERIDLPGSGRQECGTYKFRGLI
jgi:hypothetical protein